MRLHNLLLEYDTNITAQKQGPALTARWLEDSSAKRDVDGHSAQKPEDILEFLDSKILFLTNVLVVTKSL